MIFTLIILPLIAFLVPILCVMFYCNRKARAAEKLKLKTDLEDIIRNKNQQDLFVEQLPSGFYLAEKSEVSSWGSENICHFCDFRKRCIAGTDGDLDNYPCMSYSRRDGRSVLFKKNGRCIKDRTYNYDFENYRFIEE